MDSGEKYFYFCVRESGNRYANLMESGGRKDEKYFVMLLSCKVVIFRIGTRPKNAKMRRKYGRLRVCGAIFPKKYSADNMLFKIFFLQKIL